MSEPEIILYGSRLSPFVEKVARGLMIKRLSFRVVEPASPLDFARWNPVTKKIPVLEIDGEKIWDSTRILRRLDELRAQPALLSDDPATAARQRLLEDWADESLYWYAMAIRWSSANAATTAAQLSASLTPLLRPLAQFVLPWQIGGTTKAQGLGRFPQAELAVEFRSLLDDLVLQLGDRRFFFSDQPSRADLALYGQFAFLRTEASPEAAAELEERPALLQFMQRLETATEEAGATAGA